MFEAASKRESRWRIFWPDVTNLHGAQDAINLGYWAMFIMAIINLVMMLALGQFARLVDVVLMVILGLGIYFRFAIAAVLALLLVLATFVIALSNGIPPFGVLDWVVLAGSLNAVRGTLAYKRLKFAESLQPPEKESEGLTSS